MMMCEDDKDFAARYSKATERARDKRKKLLMDSEEEEDEEEEEGEENRDPQKVMVLIEPAVDDESEDAETPPGEGTGFHKEATWSQLQYEAMLQDQAPHLMMGHQQQQMERMAKEVETPAAPSAPAPPARDTLLGAELEKRN
jgi:hypothetical protein